MYLVLDNNPSLICAVDRSNRSNTDELCRMNLHMGGFTAKLGTDTTEIAHHTEYSDDHFDAHLSYLPWLL